MESFNWLDSLEHLANQLRGRHKSIEYITVLNRMLQEHTPWMERDDAPKQLAVALAKLITEGRWRVQPKEEKKWQLGWRGFRMPNKLIYQDQVVEDDIIIWHPWLAQKGAATNAKGKYREKLKRLNRHLIRCEIMNEDPFPGDILGQRERALRLFEDEKALDNMPDTGWTSVPINREELRCIKKPPPIKKVCHPQGNKPPLILENVETFHNCADINKAQPTWAYVIWGSGAQVSSQSEEIADLTISAGFDRVLYFGDLDAKGLEIVTTLRRNLQKRGVEVILEEHLYQLIIGSDLTTEEGGANYAGNFETSWMPNFIVSNLHHLMAIKKRIPQEAFIKEMLDKL